MNTAKLNLAAWAGMIGSALFVAVFVLEDFLLPNFNWLSTAVSEHALGPYGWIQITSFIVVGLLLLAFARGVAEEFREEKSSKLGPLFMTILGACILASGPFVTDPATSAAFSSQATWHGAVHGVLGAIAFTLMPLSCFVFYRHFRAEPKWRALASWTLVACIVIILAIVLLKAAQQGLMNGLLGLFQRIALVAYFGWTFVFAAGLRSQKTKKTQFEPAS
jgi:hypothetical membrane protein